jgi:hypothetical protein
MRASAKQHQRGLPFDLGQYKSSEAPNDETGADFIQRACEALPKNSSGAVIQAEAAEVLGIPIIRRKCHVSLWFHVTRCDGVGLRNPGSG